MQPLPSTPEQRVQNKKGIDHVTKQEKIDLNTMYHDSYSIFASPGVNNHVLRSVYCSALNGSVCSSTNLLSARETHKLVVPSFFSMLKTLSQVPWSLHVLLCLRRSGVGVT